MSSYTVGLEYEVFVETVYQALLEAERRDGKIGTVKIERKKIITSKSGTPAEIDIYWECELAGIKNCLAIECKNYSKKIDIPRVRDFARKISDISGLKGLIVTKIGFSDNAINEARADNIDLLIIRQHEDEDWGDRIKAITINLHMLSPSRSISIKPIVNADWLAENGYKTGDKISFPFGTTNENIVIEDIDSVFKSSVRDLEQNNFFDNKGYGQHTWKKQLVDGWIEFAGLKVKVDEIEIIYENPEIVTTEIRVDLEEYVLAVMEYIDGEKRKYTVFKSGDRVRH